jgi:hypothetical protein
VLQRVQNIPSAYLFFFSFYEVTSESFLTSFDERTISLLDIWKSKGSENDFGIAEGIGSVKLNVYTARNYL